jgi:gamma-glutamyltranspeptidase/glutathione hydrolase
MTDGLSRPDISQDNAPTYRPAVTGTRHMVVAGHYGAAHAGFRILDGGGNAVDAGVAAGIALGVLQADLVNVAGVAPIMYYEAATRSVTTISGLGTWPQAVTPDYFQKRHGGKIPEGLLRTVVPAAPDAWILALERWGTMSFGEVAKAAIRFARDGYVMYPLMAESLANNAEKYRRWPSSAAIFLPQDRPPRTGELFVQADLARSLQYMVDQENAARSKGRAAGLAAARDAFYKGDIAAAIVKYHSQNGGLMTAADMANYRSAIEPPARVRMGAMDLYTCGPWCQGPVLGQMLNLVQGFDLRSLGHNSPGYIHVVTEAMKLAFADRERWYGDPRFVDVPLERLLSPVYAAERRQMIRPDRAWPEMPPPGDAAPGPMMRAVGAPGPSLDTSYVCVVDRHGNAFSATPSDTSTDTPVIPGTGLSPSSRGSQSWADPAHASSVAPGKRPRLTPAPAIAIEAGRAVLPLGTPGGDVQAQAMLQVLLNIAVFGMNPQRAVEAPRFATMSFPDSFEPHDYHPGWLNLEGRLPKATGEDLARRGHDVHWWPDLVWRAGAVCAIHADETTGIKLGGADPRRPAYALGW